MTKQVSIPINNCAVLLLGPHGGGREDVAFRVFGHEHVLDSELIRESLGKAATNSSIMAVIQQVIADSVKAGLRIVINASLVDKARRDDILKLIPDNYDIYYIVCYKPLSERVLRYRNYNIAFHQSQELKWQSSLATINTGDFGAASVFNIDTDRILVDV